MLIKVENEFKLYPWKVKYNQHGKEHEQWATPSKEWWMDFAEKWEHTEIIKFTKIELTEEQLYRYEQIKDFIPDGFTDLCTEYILNGSFPEEIAGPLLKLQILIRNQERKEDIDTLAETSVYSMMDINDLANTLVFALNKINELEAKLND